MNKNKIGSVFFVSILALAGVGVSFAGFSDIINVYGSVSTATVEFELSYSGTWVYKIWGFPAPPSSPPGVPDEYDVDKEVLIYRGLTAIVPTEQQVINWATGNGGSASLEAQSYAIDGINGYDVHVVYDNIFPCVEFKANIVAHYIGSIPVKVSVSDFVWTTGEGYYDFSSDTTVVYEKPGNSMVQPPVQLHYCQELHIIVTIILPQENGLQGKSGAFSFNINALQWNDECNGQLTQKVLNIPDMSNVFLGEGNYGASSYWDVFPQLSYPNAYSYPLNTQGFTVKGWCVSEGEYIYANTMFSNVDYYNSLYCNDPSYWDNTYLPQGNGHEPAGYTVWDCINYIINHKVGSKQEQQKAIWYFMDGDDFTPTGNVKTMVDAASDPMVLSAWLGSGYPQTGQWVAVLLDFGYWPEGGSYSGQHRQWIFIEVDP